MTPKTIPELFDAAVQEMEHPLGPRLYAEVDARARASDAERGVEG